VKNKRLYAMVLLAAVALLQVRVAFAGCITGAHATASESIAAGCDEQPVSKASQPADTATAPCAPHCVQPYTASESDIAVAKTSPTAFTPLILFLAWVDPPAQVQLGSISTTPLPNTRLIYVFQRLLI
jgi:hypothetical protein